MQQVQQLLQQQRQVMVEDEESGDSDSETERERQLASCDHHSRIPTDR